MRTGGWRIQAPVLGRHGWLIVHLYQMMCAIRVWRGGGTYQFPQVCLFSALLVATKPWQSGYPNKAPKVILELAGTE